MSPESDSTNRSAQSPSGTSATREPERTITEPLYVLAGGTPATRVEICNLIRAAGLRVKEAFDLQGAIGICRSEYVILGVILEDHAQPCAAAMASALWQTTEVRSVIVSGSEDPAAIEAARDAGVLGYLVEPVFPRQLTPLLRIAAQRSQELRALSLEVQQLGTALKGGRAISIAIGLVMERFQVGEAEALETLRTHARSKRARLEVVAQDVLAASGRVAELFSALRTPAKLRAVAASERPQTSNS